MKIIYPLDYELLVSTSTEFSLLAFPSRVEGEFRDVAPRQLRPLLLRTRSLMRRRTPGETGQLGNEGIPHRR